MAVLSTWPVVRWDGCYDAGWKGTLVDGAFLHPAKMSKRLIERIYDELFARGALKAGDTVVDPFGGIGSTGLIGAYRGVQVVSCELESKFAALAAENYEKHTPTWEKMGKPIPMMVHGDSRQLREHVLPVIHDVAAVISSPPYAEIAAGAGGLNHLPAKHEGQQAGRSADSASQDTDTRYGVTAGQLSRLPKGHVDAAISSPPYPQPYTGGGGINVKGYGKDGADKVGARTYQSGGEQREAGNLETLNSETFWTAARSIVQECFEILAPGGVAVFVVKAFVRNKMVVDFPGDWCRLCAHVGFTVLQEVHASLVTETRHGHLFDGEIVKRTEKKSFFRRVHEQRNPSTRIDHEVVWFFRKTM